jgi:hypothetical protein
MATAEPTTQAAIQIERLGRKTMVVPIKGLTPLIVHNWSDKARRQMLDSQQGIKRPKEHRDPQADYEASKYHWIDSEGTERDGFPALGFKGAIVSAARLYGTRTVKMTELRAGLFVNGILGTQGQLLIPIDGEPQMREDVVRVGMGTDLRFRAEYPEWSALIEVTFIDRMLARDSVLGLLDAAGLAIGVGEWRPEKDGLNGTFAIDTDRDVIEQDA